MDRKKEVPFIATINSSQPRLLRLIVILGALSAFGPFSIDMYLPSLPSLSRDFGIGSAEAQLTLSACLLGLAVGQLVVGPISDALGRRRPLLVCLVAYAFASFLCVMAPSILVLVILRFIQGFAGASGIVVARAVVRDMFTGLDVARFFSLLMLVNGLAPILAPLIGGQLLHFTSWRGVFVVLMVIGMLIFVAVFFGLRETLLPENRQRGGIRTLSAAFRQLISSRSFIGYALSYGLAFAAMFSYISGSPFVLQGVYGISPQLFSIIFGTNALGLMLASQINGRLVSRVPLLRLLTIGLSATAVGGIALLLVATLGHGSLIGVLLSLFVVVASLGLILPNATTLALADHRRIAGSASALIGVLQFAIGALAAPLVGVSGTTSARPMAIVIAILGLSSLIVFLLLVRFRSTSPGQKRRAFYSRFDTIVVDTDWADKKEL